ncbi:MAG: acyltransferase family protein [Rhizobiaceae bacterium]
MAIGFAVFGFDNETHFPGINAALPVLGAALLIWAVHPARDPIYVLLRMRPMVKIGKVSYGWYLWHWPAYVLLPFFVGADAAEAPVIRLTSAIITFGIAILSYKLIERPIVRKLYLPRRTDAYALFAMTVVAGLILSSPGFYEPLNRLRTEIVYREISSVLDTISAEERLYRSVYNLNYTGISAETNSFSPAATCSFDHMNTRQRVTECLIRQARGPSVLLIGDSVGRDTFHSLRMAYPETNFIMLHQSSCPPAEFLLAGARRCFPEMNGIIDDLNSLVSIQAVFLAFRHRQNQWTVVESTLQDLRARFESVVLFSTIPVWQIPLPRHLIAARNIKESLFVVSTSNAGMIPWSYAEIVSDAREMAVRSGVRHIDVLSCFCTSDECFLFDGADMRKPLFWDQFHLTRFGISRLAIHLRASNELKEILLSGRSTVGIGKYTDEE